MPPELTSHVTGSTAPENTPGESRFIFRNLQKHRKRTSLSVLIFSVTAQSKSTIYIPLKYLKLPPRCPDLQTGQRFTLRLVCYELFMLLKGLGEMKMFWQNSPPPLCTANQFYVAGVQMYQYSRQSACLLNEASAPRLVIQAKPTRLGQSDTQSQNEQLKKKKQNPKK